MTSSYYYRRLAVFAALFVTAAPVFAISPIAQAVIASLWDSLVPSMLTLLSSLTAAGATLWVARVIMRKFGINAQKDDFSGFELQAEESNIDAARRRAMERSQGSIDDTPGKFNDEFGGFELDGGGGATITTS